jgi:hypothetical protein
MCAAGCLKSKLFKSVTTEDREAFIKLVKNIFYWTCNTPGVKTLRLSCENGSGTKKGQFIAAELDGKVYRAFLRVYKDHA